MEQTDSETGGSTTILRRGYDGEINAVVAEQSINVRLRIHSNGRKYALFGVLLWNDIPAYPSYVNLRVRVGEGPVYVIGKLQIKEGQIELTTFTSYLEGSQTTA